MKTLRLVIALNMIVSYFAIAILDFSSMDRGWKVPILGIMYGICNVFIFLVK